MYTFDVSKFYLLECIWIKLLTVRTFYIYQNIDTERFYSTSHSLTVIYTTATLPQKNVDGKMTIVVIHFILVKLIYKENFK